MSSSTQKKRAVVAAMTVTDAQTSMRRLIRRAGLRSLWNYAQRHHITDFADAILVEQAHRDQRQNAIAAAQTRVVTVNTATSIADILAVFDEIEPLLE